MIVVAGMMRHVFAMADIDTVGKGLTAGLGLGAFVALPWILTNYAYSMRPRMLSIIDGSYAVIGCTIMGIILALQLAPTLKQYGSLDRIADIVGIAMFRELGPLLSAIVLSGFAGASIAAEIGAMVEAEEIKALRAHALNPIRFLAVPRLLATVMMLIGLTVIADVVGVLGGMLTSWGVLDIRPAVYLENTRIALLYKDFFTGLIKAGVFGVLISMIACYEGFNVRGGAEGVGRATTATVVKSIVALIATDCVFTAIFYLFEI